MNRTYTPRRLVACGVFVVAMSSLVVFGNVLLTMAASGQTSATVAFDSFGEFGIEFAIFSAATVFLPVLLYEITELAGQNT